VVARKTPEADAQRAIVAILRIVLPRGSIVHHSPNEVGFAGARARNRQAILDGMGVFRGFSDLVVISDGRVMFLEVKSRAGRLSETQERFRDLVQAQGLPWALVRSPEDAVAALKGAGFYLSVRGVG
jgi:hypothetical protein